MADLERMSELFCHIFQDHHKLLQIIPTLAVASSILLPAELINLAEWSIRLIVLK
jgi:hypothetical protein